MSFDAAKVQRILNTIPSKYRGPGGAIAVLKDGQLVGQKVWGYADMERRIHLTPQTLMPICSITKQFVSALLFDLSQNPPATMDKSLGTFDEQMLARLRELLPTEFVEKGGMTVDNLVDMASGLRDYWALCTVEGSRPETIYSLHEHNADMLKRIKSLHFEPGSEYSYANTNFNVVERLIEQVTKNTLDNLLSERILRPAGMTTARLNPRTDRLPAPIIGYEGSEKLGFFPAPNFIEWSADAGMVASLNDMIAYETSFDSKYGDKQGGYRNRVTTQKYKDGAHAPYRYGLANTKLGDFVGLGHGGALRGFKLMRYYVASERLSVITMFNSNLDAPEAAETILKQILNVPETPTLKIDPSDKWFGSYLDEETQLAVRVSPNGQGKVSLLYSRSTENLKLVDATHAKTQTVEASIDGDLLQVRRIYENRVLKAKRLARNTDSSAKPPVQGRYRCGETESTFICEGEDDMLYAMFDGYFGSGPPHLMTYLGDDVWVFADPRAMDDTPPGDWTVAFVRDAQGAVIKAHIGCWLARKLEFVRS